jgi:hypothetical protein|tara:strand:+ start:5580 stop:6026 length:447 start_codon:yes stop_codon:yes gene_type:complete
MGIKKMVISISEILKKANSFKKIEDRVKYLQNNSSKTLKKVLGYCFDPRVVWKLPEGPPPDDLVKYAHEAADIQGALFREDRRLDYLIESPQSKNLTTLKREQIFIQLLEMIDREDAKLIISIKDKKLPYKNITKKVVQQAFPTLGIE